MMKEVYLSKVYVRNGIFYGQLFSEDGLEISATLEYILAQVHDPKREYIWKVKHFHNYKADDLKRAFIITKENK